MALPIGDCNLDRIESIHHHVYMKHSHSYFSYHDRLMQAQEKFGPRSSSWNAQVTWKDASPGSASERFQASMQMNEVARGRAQSRTIHSADNIAERVAYRRTAGPPSGRGPSYGA